jgi:RHS repeat-associated protein
LDLIKQYLTQSLTAAANNFGNGLLGRIDSDWSEEQFWDPEEMQYYLVWVRTDNRYYYLKDHLGSIRVTVDDSGDVVAYDDYDPWGMILNGRSGLSIDDGRYKFTGKERDAETSYDYFGARYYDSRIGRWLSVDPLADKYPGWSPYNYCFNNPINVVDPTGMEGVESTISYDEHTETHTITSSESKVQSRQFTTNEDGSVTTTETIVTTTTTAMIRDGKFVDSNGNEVNSITQTTTTTTAAYTSTGSAFNPTVNSLNRSTSTSQVSPSANKLASAIASWQNVGNAGTPFNTTQDFLNLAGSFSDATSIGEYLISSFPRRLSIAGVIIGAGATILEATLENTNSINNRHFYDINAENPGHRLHKYYKK